MNKLLQKYIPAAFLICNIAVSTACYAIEVVRANFEFQGAIHPVDISLFDTVASGTVSNFLSYVDDSSYDNLLIQRNVPGFVIQAGAYTYDESLNDGSFSYDGNGQYNGGLQLVTPKDSIQNEFKLSNVRGTLAMARLGGQVNSASNQWFINLGNNNSLDSVDEGFTVFGKVLGNGMGTIDLVSGIPAYNLNDDFNSVDIVDFTAIPLVDYTISSTINDIIKNNLVVINSIDRLFKVTDVIDFDDAVVSNTVARNIIIQNYNAAELKIDTSDILSVTAPFTVINNPCQNATLLLNDQCTIQIEFNPASTGYFADSFNIEILTYGYTFPVTLKTPAPEISASPDTINFGVQPIYDPAENPTQTVIQINNSGDRTLNISAVTFNTQTPDEFQLIDNCTAANINNNFTPGEIPAGGFCILVINFKPADLSEKSGVISIISDDPVNNQLDLQVTGGASSDNDGIKNSIENAAPNNGDGNNDGIPDRLQNTVVSFPNINNTYTTLVTNDSVSFSNVKSVQLSTIGKLPDGVLLENEAFAFELTGFPVGSIAEFGLILPSGNSPANIYSYGSTPDNNSTHWYTLEKNSIPGAIMFGNAPLLNSSGNSINRNMTMVRISDGGYGDSDLQVNGRILFVGGPEISSQTPTSSGTTLWMLFLIPLSIIIYRR